MDDVSISVSSVYRSFGRRPVIRDISLQVKRGELFGLLGPSGSGKTTLVRLMTGLDVPDSGTVSLFGETMPRLSVLSRVGYMAQADALYGELTGKDNLRFFAGLYGLKGERLTARMHAAAALTRLTGELGKPVQQYSGGMKRRLSLAVALMHEPELLVLDEPTVGIDPVLRRSIWAEMEKLRQGGVTIVVTTHVMDEADKCDRLAMIRDGQAIAVGTPAELMSAAGAETMEQAFIAYSGGGEQ